MTLTLLLAFSLVGFDDRPEDERFETENRANLKKSEHAPSRVDAKESDEPEPKKKDEPKEKSKAIPAEKVKEIAALKGKEATVEGKVFQVFVPKGDGLAVFNMGSDFKKCFSVVVRSKSFEKFGGLEKLKEYKGKSIRVEGTVSIYRDLPQIEVSVPSQLSVK